MRTIYDNAYDRGSVVDIPITESRNKTRMGRRPLGVKFTGVRLGNGIPKRIDAVLDEHESRAAFIRKAVDAELKRREQAQRSKRKQIKD
jgi:hypothetical protein